MATIPSTAGHNTLLDIAKTFGPDGKVMAVAELLNQSNEVLYDMNFIEGNLPTGHKASVRVGLPTINFRKFYQGVAVTKSGRATIEDVCGMLEARSEVDKDLAELNGNSAAFRLSEAKAFIEAMNQTFAQNIFYGDTGVTKEGILGLAPRYNSLSATSGANIIDAGGTGSDNTSVWLVVWGAETLTGIYPKGSQAGLTQQDLGEYDAFDGSSNRFRALGELFKWKFGLHVKDWRYAVRIANIDVSDLASLSTTQTTTSATLVIKLMAKAMARIPSMGMGKACFYANRTVKEMMSIAAMDKSQNALSFVQGLDQFGKVAPGSVAGTGTGIQGGTLLFQGVPVRTVDQILSTETRIV